MAVPVFPDGSVTDATTVWGPAVRVSALRAHTPELACPVKVCEPMVTVTRGVPGSSVVPEIDGVASLVALEAPPAMVTTGAVRSSIGLGDRAVGERHGARGEDAPLERGTVPEGDHARAEDGPDPLDVGAERDRADRLPVDVVGESAVREDDLGGRRGAECRADLEDETGAGVACGIQGDRARVRDGRRGRVEPGRVGLAGLVTGERGATGLGDHGVIRRLAVLLSGLDLGGSDARRARHRAWRESRDRARHSEIQCEDGPRTGVRDAGSGQDREPRGTAQDHRAGRHARGRRRGRR